jgi:hypothetical protein
VISTIAAFRPLCTGDCAGGGVAVDGAGRVFFTDYGSVKMFANGTITTIAGGGTNFHGSGDGGPATSAGLNAAGIAVTSDGTLFIADSLDCRVRKVSQGVITTVAGNGTCCGGDGGDATKAGLDRPSAVAGDGQGNLYISEFRKIRKVTNGIITTIAPTSFFEPVFADSAGNVYVGWRTHIDRLNMLTIAGGSKPGFGGDGGPSVAALLNTPRGLAVDPYGRIYFSDTSNNRIRVLVPASELPFGSFDTPTDHLTGVAGAIPVTGWALSHVGVSTVGIWREPLGSEPVASNGLVYIGNATFVAGARPDVQAAYSAFPLNDRAGWGYMLLTNNLPGANGTFKLHAIARDTSGLAVDLGVKTITVDNLHSTKPFGTIDTPDQGGSISGSQYNFGWALTPQPQCIPLDGSTITVIVDGVVLGHPTYNQPRGDIMGGFPGYCNTNGAVGFYLLDSSRLSNGVHTIQLGCLR